MNEICSTDEKEKRMLKNRKKPKIEFKKVMNIPKEQNK